MASASKSRPSPAPKSQPPAARHRVEIRINVYDLLPPGHLSSVLWNLGSSMLHSGVVINNKEYAYGAHEKRGISGVYYTDPEWLPPGATFRCSILHGIALRSQAEIDAIVVNASKKFLGPQWNLLRQNCNHFTSYLCEQLVGRPPPRWLNRAASIGVAMPCIVPSTWLSPPDPESAPTGELIDEHDSDDDDEHRPMLTRSRQKSRRPSDEDDDDMSYEGSEASRSPSPSPHRMADRRRNNKFVAKTDSSGRLMPVSERAPPPR